MDRNSKALGVLGVVAAGAMAMVMWAQPPVAPPDEPARAPILPREDPKEIPLPVIKTDMKPMPGVAQLPDHPGMPDVMTLNDGKKVKTVKQWDERRTEMFNT